MYSPFKNKQIGNLSFDDIKELKERNVTEGFYVEYKSDFQKNPLKIAHSIASFANTHGGWYFVGIKSDKTNLPIDFPGLNLLEILKPIEHLRNIIKENIDPFPVYFTKLIEIGNNRAILVVEIPKSDETPHITKDGLIYRRQSEGSDPLQENNRYVLDELYKRSIGFKSVITEFSEREIILTKAEENNCYLEIYIMTYPLHGLIIDNCTSEAFVNKLKARVNDYTKIFFGDNIWMNSQIIFNNISASKSSIIFKQINQQTLPFTTLTFEFFYNGNARIIIPFERMSNTTNLGTAAWAKLVSTTDVISLSTLRIINGFNALSTFLTLTHLYFDILKSENWKEEVLIFYRIRNSWRTVLFFDCETFAKHIDEFGLPLCREEETWIPGNQEKECLVCKIPKDGFEMFSEFMIIAACFGIFPHEGAKFFAEWIKKLNEGLDKEQKNSRPSANSSALL